MVQYSKEIADRICLAVATSRDGIETICKAEGMPDFTTVYDWLHKRPEFADQYYAAKQFQMDLLADSCLARAEAADNSNYNETRLQIDTIKWLASKLAPKRYGDKITHASDPDAPIVTNPSADALIAFLLAKGATEHEIRAFIAAPNTIEHNPTKDKV